MKIISLYKKHTSFFLYGAFAFSILLWIGYGHITKYDDLLKDSPEIKIYLNFDGTFKTDEYKSLEKNKKDLFWQHQLGQVERKLQSYKKSIGFNYEESTYKARQLRDQSIRDSYTSAIASASSDLERISLDNSFRVSRAENLASDLKEDGDYRLNKLITEREIRNLEALKAFIAAKLDLR